MISEILKRKPLTSPIFFDYDGETIEAKVYLFKRSELPLLLEMAEDSRALIDETFFQRNGYFWICYNQQFGWFGLHTID